MHFRYFITISSWKRAWTFIWTKLNFHHQRMLCAKFADIDPVVLEQKMKMWNVYKQMENKIDEWQTTGDQKNLLELSAQMN